MEYEFKDLVRLTRSTDITCTISLIFQLTNVALPTV